MIRVTFRARVALWCALQVRQVLTGTAKQAGPGVRAYMRWSGIDVDGLLLELREIPQGDLESDLGRVETFAGAR